MPDGKYLQMDLTNIALYDFALNTTYTFTPSVTTQSGGNIYETIYVAFNVAQYTNHNAVVGGNSAYHNLWVIDNGSLVNKGSSGNIDISDYDVIVFQVYSYDKNKYGTISIVAK